MGSFMKKLVRFEQRSKEYRLQDILAVRTPELVLSCQASMKSLSNHPLHKLLC